MTGRTQAYSSFTLVSSYILQDEADMVKRMACQAFTTNLDKAIVKNEVCLDK